MTGKSSNRSKWLGVIFAIAFGLSACFSAPIQKPDITVPQQSSNTNESTVPSLGNHSLSDLNTLIANQAAAVETYDTLENDIGQVDSTAQSFLNATDENRDSAYDAFQGVISKALATTKTLESLLTSVENTRFEIAQSSDKAKAALPIIKAALEALQKTEKDCTTDTCKKSVQDKIDTLNSAKEDSLSKKLEIVKELKDNETVKAAIEKTQIKAEVKNLILPDVIQMHTNPEKGIQSVELSADSMKSAEAAIISQVAPPEYKWALADSSIASLKVNDQDHSKATLTAQKIGLTTLTVTVGSQTQSTEVIVGKLVDDYVISQVASRSSNADSQYQGLAIDKAGNIYFSDNHVIRKQDTSGKIQTYAGTGETGSQTDGETATQAKLIHPEAFAISNDGSLYFVNLDIILKIDKAGKLQKVAGTLGGGRQFSGDGGKAVDAGFSEPKGLAFDKAGNLYIADLGHNRIRKVDTAGTITTIAGNGNKGSSGDGGKASEAKLNSPYALAFDSSGNLYISEFSGNRIRKIDTNGMITTFAGTGEIGSTGDGGRAIEAKLNGAQGLVFDRSGNLYISEFLGSIRKIDDKGVITTFVGNGGTVQGGFNFPSSSAFDRDGNLNVSDTRGIYKVTHERRAEE